jgi:hypothetical protein
VEAVHRRDGREAGPPLRIQRMLDGGGDRRLAGAGRSGNSEQEPVGRAVDRLEQPLDQGIVKRGCAYSLLEAAQRLIPLSVA